MDTHTDRRHIPLVVDLDGTVIATDLFWEALVAAIKQNVLVVFMVPFWLLKGKAFLKSELAKRVVLNVATLPYRQEFIDYLRTQKAAGRTLILATGSPEPFARAIAAHLSLFSEVIATTPALNLTSTRKRDALTAKFGDAGFDYAGNSRDDVPVFDAAGQVIVVAPDGAAARFQKRSKSPLFAAQRVTVRTLVKLLRVHQWAKNSLIAVPAVLANDLARPATEIAIVLAMIAFSLLASAIYIINDLFDLESDRRHKTKFKRPIAAGVIAIPTALVVAGLLTICSVAFALYLPPLFGMVLAGYALLTTLYTFALKRMLLIDVLALAGLYTIRVIAGAAATQIDVSFWLLAFSVFFFLSLALVKRYVELEGTPDTGLAKISGRGYRVSDSQVLAESGIAATFSSVLVLAMYIDSDQVRLVYHQPYLLWLLCPIVLYLSLRIWVLARRGEMHEDPVVFILSDWRSQIMVLIGAALVFIAAW